MKRTLAARTPRTMVGATPATSSVLPTLLLVGGAAAGTFTMLKGHVMTGTIILGASLLLGSTLEQA